MHRFAVRTSCTHGVKSTHKFELSHLCLDVIFDEVDDVAKIVMEATWADQLLHLTGFMATGYLADQPELDTICCEGAQTCKQYKCPKSLLHEAPTFSTLFAY